MHLEVRLPPPPWIAAHRGALPLLENTIPACLLAVEEGADLLEFDVQATADGALVLFHDADVGRLGGRPDLVVEGTTLRELAALELRNPDHPERRGGIPTLAALLAALPHRFPVNIELKVDRSDRGRLAALALEAVAGRPNVLFSSFDTALLRELRRRSAAARLAPLAERWTEGLEVLGEEIGAWSLHVATGVAEARRAAPEGRAGPPLLVYTVNDAATARQLLAQGASGLFSDRPGPLRAELGMPGDSGVLSTTYRGR
jgi:glycerophosphoryl diester phosphodiesterase